MNEFVPTAKDGKRLVTSITREFVENVLSNKADYSDYNRVYAVIGDSVNTINDNAFDTEQLSDINHILDKTRIQSFPKSVTVIGDNAFYNSPVCQDAYLTFDLYHIGRCAFNGATIKSLTINNSNGIDQYIDSAFDGLSGDSLNLNDISYLPQNDANNMSINQFSAPNLTYADTILRDCHYLSSINFSHDAIELNYSIINCPDLSSLTITLTDIYGSVTSCRSLERIDIIGIPEDSYIHINGSFNSNWNLVSACYYSSADHDIEIYSSFRNCPKLSPNSKIFEYATIIDYLSFSNSISDEAYALSCIDLPNIQIIQSDCFTNSTIGEFKFGNKLDSIPLLTTSATTFSFPNSTCCHVATLENYDQITSNGINVIAGKDDIWGTLDYAGKTFDNSSLSYALSKIEFPPEQIHTLYLPFISAIAISPNADTNNIVTYDNIVLSNVTSLNIDDGKKYNGYSNLSIGIDAFQGMPKLQSLIVKSPKQYIYISDRSFSGLKKLTNIVFNNHVSILEIGKAAFQSCSNFTGINELLLQADSVRIGNYAFSDCDGLHQLNLKNSDNIGDYAFSNCKNLLDVYIKSCTSVGSGAFAYCSKLASLRFEWYYKTRMFGDGITRGCNDLTSISLPPNTKYKLSNDMIIDTTENSVKAAMKNATSIPNGISRITPYAFGDMHNTNITCPSSVTIIDGHAFDGCTELMSFDLPTPMISSVGEYAFNNCKKIRNIREIANNCKNISSYAFSGCISANDQLDLSNLSGYSEYMFADSGVTRLTLTNSINSNNAFSNMHMLSKVDFQNSQTITNIPYGTFQYDDNLIQLTNCDNITSLGGYAFEGCKNLVSVDFSKVNTIPYCCFMHCTSLTTANCIETASYIDDYSFAYSGINDVRTNANIINNAAFSYCKNLRSVIIGKDVDTIRVDSFSYSGNIRSFNVDQANTKYYSTLDGLFDATNNQLMFMTSGIESYILTGSVYDYAFTTNDALTSIIISTDYDDIEFPQFPSSIQHLSCIGNHRYWTNDRGDCLLTDNNVLVKGTVNTVIPSYVQSIDRDAFYNVAITDINFDSPYLTAYSGEFNNCPMLSSIKFGSQLLHINNRAFDDIKCDSLHKLDFSETHLQSIDYYAFTNNSIRHIILPSTCQIIASDAFCNINNSYYSSLTSLQFDMPETEISVIPNYPWGLSPRIITSTDRWKRTLHLGESVEKQDIVNSQGILYYDGDIGGTAIMFPTDINKQHISICNCRFTYNYTETYTGDEICPLVVVEYNGNALIEDQDYMIEYFDNVQRGFAKIVVSGKNKFDDTRTLYFTIQ